MSENPYEAPREDKSPWQRRPWKMSADMIVLVFAFVAPLAIGLGWGLLLLLIQAIQSPS